MFRKFIEELSIMMPKEGAYSAFFDEEIPCKEISSDECLSTEPLVSVKIITYNHQHYIEQAVESVVHQKTSFDFEILLAEDRSSDATFDICKHLQAKYPDKIRLLYSDENVGMFRNSIRALKRARGRYVALLEGDDYWIDEFKLEDQVALLSTSGRNLCVAYTNCYSETTKLFREIAYPKKTLLDFRDFRTGVVYATSSFVFRTDAYCKIIDYLKHIPGYDTSYAMLLSCCNDSGAICLHKVVSIRRETGAGLATGVSPIHLMERGADLHAKLAKFGPKSLTKVCRAQMADHYLQLARLRMSKKYDRDIGKSMCDLMIFSFNIIPWLLYGGFSSRLESIMRKYYYKKHQNY